MSDLTEAEVLGVGMAFLTNWDYRTSGGSIDIDRGIAILERDLSFKLQQEIEPERGELISQNAQEDIRIATRRILRHDDRVSDFSIGEVHRKSDATDAIEVETEVTAITDERADLILRL